MKIVRLGFFFPILMLPLIQCGELLTGQKKYLQNFFSDQLLRKMFAPFLVNTLRIVNADDFFTLVDTIQVTHRPTTHKEWYSCLSNTISAIKPYLSAYYVLKALAYQKRELAKQAEQIFKNKETIEGYLEIGTPGTYVESMKSLITINGPIYVLHDKQRITDYAQAFNLSLGKKFLSYDSFVPLNNYEPIKPEDIADNSLDLVVCFIGLHHIPVEKLDPFIASIARVLRPGGRFLLRDHDCHTEVIMTMAHVAHSVFNLVIANEPLQAELSEYRNFQPLDYWISLLTRYHFKIGVERLIQKDDPTANTMVCFTKIPSTLQEKLFVLSRTLQERPGYQRSLMQTYLTASEWLSVDLSQAEGRFTKQNSWYSFPYFTSVCLAWKIFARSWEQARRTNTLYAVLFSDYTMMNSFINCMMTIKYSSKGIISLPFYYIGSTKRGAVEKRINHIQTEYGSFIEDTPFYEYHYFKNINRLWKTYGQSLREEAQQKGLCSVLLSSLKKHDLLFALLATMEYAVDGAVSLPVRYMFGGAEPGFMYLLIEDQENLITSLAANIRVVETYPELRMALIEVPRYKEFLKIIDALSEKNIKIQEIAGQKEIQVKVKYATGVDCSPNIEGCVKEYNWSLPSEPEFTYTTMTISVDRISDLLRYLRAHNIHLSYIHDF